MPKSIESPRAQAVKTLARLLREAASRGEGLLLDIRDVFKKYAETMTGFDGIVSAWASKHMSLIDVQKPLTGIARDALKVTGLNPDLASEVAMVFIAEVLTYHPVWGLLLHKVLEPWESLDPIALDDDGWGLKRWVRLRRHPQQAQAVDTPVEVYVCAKDGTWYYGARGIALEELQEGGKLPEFYTVTQRFRWFNHLSVRGDVHLAVSLEQDKVDAALRNLGYTLK